jgi:hypothetical protein
MLTHEMVQRLIGLVNSDLSPKQVRGALSTP